MPLAAPPISASAAPASPLSGLHGSGRPRVPVPLHGITRHTPLWGVPVCREAVCHSFRLYEFFCPLWCRSLYHHAGSCGTLLVESAMPGNIHKCLGAILDIGNDLCDPTRKQGRDANIDRILRPRNHPLWEFPAPLARGQESGRALVIEGIRLVGAKATDSEGLIEAQSRGNLRSPMAAPKSSPPDRRSLIGVPVDASGQGTNAPRRQHSRQRGS